MYQAINYIKTQLGIDVEIHSFDQSKTKGFPSFITSIYDFYEGNIQGKSVVFAKFLSGKILAPSNYAKHEKMLKQTCKCPIIFVFDKVQSYNKIRLLSLGINFIVPQSQIYMPELFIILSNKAPRTKQDNQSKFLSPTAQAVLLFYFYSDTNNFSYYQIQDALTMPYQTVCRAIERLQALEICKVYGLRDKIVHFEEDKTALLNRTLPTMKSPVKRVIYADESPEHAAKSGLSALSEYTMINPDEYDNVAISFEESKKMESFSCEDNFCPVHIEVWNYNPRLFAHKDIVDKISLYLSLKDNHDERIQYELKQLIKHLW